MISGFKKIAYLLLVLAYWMPFVAKLDHHHIFVPCKDSGKLHFHDRHEKCKTCSFDFSVCSDPPSNFSFSETDYPDIVLSGFYGNYFPGNPYFSFLLRGPPASVNLI